MWTPRRVGGLLGTVGLLALTYGLCWRAQVLGGLGPVGLADAQDGDVLTVTLYEIGTIEPPDRYRVRHQRHNRPREQTQTTLVRAGLAHN